MIVSLQPTPPKPIRFLAYGDSITVGDKATTPALGWMGRLASYWTNAAVVMEAWSGRGLYDDGATAAQRTAFTTQLLAYNPTILWIAIGFNEFLNDRMTPAQFVTAYSDLLDKLHAAAPMLTIYSQKPGVTLWEGNANFLGYTSADYRTAMNAMWSARPWLRTTDGTTYYTTTDLFDDVHPGDAGHLKYFNAVKAVLGI